MAIFIFIASVYFIFHGAIHGRIDGGGIAKVSEWVERTLVMSGFVMAAVLFSDWWGLLAYAGVVGIATGHGQYFLNRAVKYIGDKPDGKKGSYERVDPIVRLLFGKDPRTDTKFANMPKAEQVISMRGEMEVYGMTRLYWRNVFGMFVTGSLVGLPAAIISVCFGQYQCAAIFACTGIAKAIAYVIGYRFFVKKENPSGTEAAEYINGGLRNVICLAVILLVVL